jgi:acyl-coenzyme A thioesterase PaaI-like protein
MSLTAASQRTPDVRAARNSRCFACGTGHPHGLHLRFTPDEDRGVTAIWHTKKTWEGFEGVIHGGIVSTVLDEAMSKAVAVAGVSALTCELRVRLRHHIESGRRLHAGGWIVERRKRRITAEASLTDDDGTERAHAWATFLEVAPAPGGAKPNGGKDTI